MTKLTGLAGELRSVPPKQAGKSAAGSGKRADLLAFLRSCSRRRIRDARSAVRAFQRAGGSVAGMVDAADRHKEKGGELYNMLHAFKRATDAEAVGIAETAVVRHHIEIERTVLCTRVEADKLAKQAEDRGWTARVRTPKRAKWAG